MAGGVGWREHRCLELSSEARALLLLPGVAPVLGTGPADSLPLNLN